jgi:4-amino-4-deoxy-L-arabinose transferase-like glycosyltransferase
MSRFLLIPLALYFSIRLIHLTLLPIFNDEAIYLDWGWRETHVPGMLYYSIYDSKPPLLMWFFGIFESIFADPLFAGRLVSVIAGAFTLLGLYCIAKKLFNRTIAVLASLLYCFSPLFVFFDRQALMESAIAAVGVWICYYSLLLWETKNEKYAYYIGMLMGAGFFIKFSAAIYFFAYYLITFAIFLKSNHKMSVVKQSGITLGIFCAATALLFINPEFWSTLHRNAQYSLTIPELFSFPLTTWVKKSAANSEIAFFYLTPIATLLSLCGIWLLLKKNSRKHLLLVFWLLLCFILQTCIVRSSSQRYLVSYLPLYVIPAAFILQQVWIRQKVLGWILIVCTFIIPVCFTTMLLFAPQQYIAFMSKIDPYSEVGYIAGQTSGYGIVEVKHYLETVSKKQKIFVGYANNTGNPENALAVYYEKNERITTGILDGRDLRFALQKYNCLSLSVPFYYVTRNNELNGLEKFLEKRKTIQTPNSSYSIGIYTTKHFCVGKRLEIGVEK